MMFAITIAAWKDTVVGVAAALVALGIIYRYVIKPIVHGTRNAWRTIEDVGDAVAFVKAEMKPNGGSSLRDAVNRIESQGNNHEARLATVESAVAAIPSLADAIAALEAKLREPVASSTTTTHRVKTVEPAHIDSEVSA